MYSRFLFGLVLLCSLASTRAADDEASWSKPVNGLRGRLLVYAPDDASAPFCKVKIELENCSGVFGDFRVPFDLDKIAFQVADQTGKAIPPTPVFYSGIYMKWPVPLIIPCDGSIKFTISNTAAACHKSVKSVIDLGSSNVWIVPQDGSQFALSGVLKVVPWDRFDDSRRWNGTLTFPPVLIPASK